MRRNSSHGSFGMITILNEVLAEIIAIAITVFDCVGWAINDPVTIIEQAF